jgi:glycine oxidase
MNETADAIVVGGGVIGCAVAYYLSTFGVRPLLLERGALAAEASGANAGMVSASSGLAGRTLDYSRKSMELLARDAEELGRPVEFVRQGRLMLALTPEHLAEMHAFAIGLSRGGLDARLLSGDDARALDPTLGPAILGAVYIPEDGHVNPFLLTHAYASGAKRRGAIIRQGVQVTRIEVSKGRVTGVSTRSGRVEAPLVIVAAGAWSPSLLAPLGIALPISPGRGQMLATVAIPPLTARVLRSPVVGLRQDVRGHVIIGSTVEYVGFTKAVTPPVLARLCRLALAIAPALQGVPIVRAWAGLRPMTPDGLAIIDAVPSTSGLILASGHSRTGVTYASVTGWLVAQLATRGTTDLPLDPFRLDRFGASTYLHENTAVGTHGMG